jgi:PAS domain S-box-containing protein
MTTDIAALEALLAETRRALAEANETLDAIRNGDVDAVVVGGPAGQIVYTLENADRPYRVLVERMREGAVTLSSEGMILYANRSFEELIGRASGDVLGTSLFDHVADRMVLAAMLECDTVVSTEVSLVNATRAAVPVNLSIVELQVEDGAQRMLCGIVTDLSHNYARAAEIADAHARLAGQAVILEASEARLRTMFDTSYQFQAMLSPAGILLDANRVSLQAIAAELEDVVGQPYWETPWFSATPGMDQVIRSAIETVIAGGTAHAELLLELPEGGTRSFDFSLRGIRNADNVLTAMIPEAADLTAVRRTEEALRQAQKLEAIGQLTGGVAHDFNNLLTVIRGSVELLQRPNLTEAKRARYINAIGETTDRASRLTSQLLAFARRQTLKPELFDVSSSLENVRGIVASLSGSRIELETILPPDPCYVLADRNQFDTAIVNLAINARDAMDGEGSIRIAASGVSEMPGTSDTPVVHGDFLSIAVSDTGSGIAAENIDRIFEPFFTTKGVGSGTGLGLSQVIGFAKQSAGDVRVESEVGVGTTFTLYLPRAAAGDGLPEVVDPPREMSSGDGVFVLVVEDNADVGSFAKQALSELGYDSVLAANADAALLELEKDCARFHIVFSDVIMPGTNGIELAKMIEARYPGIPVVLASGYSEVLAQGGAQGYELIHKPYSIEELSRVIRRALLERAV